jgi:hypothetical protein
VVEGETLAGAGGEEEDVVLECQPRPIGHWKLRHRRSPALGRLLFGCSPRCLVESAIWWILVGSAWETPSLGCRGKTAITVAGDADPLKWGQLHVPAAHR